MSRLTISRGLGDYSGEGLFGVFGERRLELDFGLYGLAEHVTCEDAQ